VRIVMAHMDVSRLIAGNPIYPDQARVVNDVDGARRTFPYLLPQIDNMVTNDGRQRRLLCLRGTIPCWYKGNTYNIPLDVWITENYPTAPPTCFVTPTADMMVKPGHQHVGSDGMCYLPFLTNWATNPWAPQNNITQLLVELRDVFTAQMPVYQKPKQQPPAYTAPQPQAQRHHPPYVQPQPAAQPYGQQPPYSQPLATQNYLQPPPQPPVQPYQQPPPQPPQPAQPPPYRQPQQGQRPPEFPGQRDTFAGASLAAFHQPVQPVAEDPAKAEKRRQVERIAHKLREVASQFREEMQREVGPLQAVNERLLSGHALLLSDEEVLREMLQQLRANMQQSLQTTDMLDSYLASLGAEEEENIEELLVYHNTPSKQLVDCVAEDHAIQDTYLAMDKMLNSQNTDLESFLTETRKLATRQFMVRALGKKITTQLQRQ